MKKISYSTMALLLTCSALTTSAITASEDQLPEDGENREAAVLAAEIEPALSKEENTFEVQPPAPSSKLEATALAEELVTDSSATTSGNQNTRIIPNLSMQSAPKFGEMVSGAASKLANLPVTLAQVALGLAGVKTKAVYIQPLSAFEIAAAARFANEKSESKEGTCESKAQTRCKTIKAYEYAMERRNLSDVEFLMQDSQKFVESQLRDFQVKITKEDVKALESQSADIQRQKANQLSRNLGRGLGLLPGMHATIKDGYHYSVFTGSTLCKLPSDYDLRTGSKVTGTNFPMVLDQGGTMSCVSQAFSSAMNFARRAQGLSDGRVPSRHFIWSWTRQIGNSGQPFDGKIHKGLGNWGCNMGIAGDLVSTQGAPSESDIGSEWYSDMGWHAGVSNSATSYDSNLLSLLGHAETDVASPLVFIHQSDTNTRDANALAIKCALHNGYPVLAAIDVRRSSYFNGAANSTGDWVTPFSDASVNNSVYPNPVGQDADGNDIYAAGDFSVGGHAILLVGYNDNSVNSDGTPNGKFTFMNSWGTGWGNNGFGTLPYEYVCGTSTSYAAPTGANAIQANVADGKGGSIANTMFSNAPYAGFFAQIKSCTK